MKQLKLWESAVLGTTYLGTVILKLVQSDPGIRHDCFESSFEIIWCT